MDKWFGNERLCLLVCRWVCGPAFFGSACLMGLAQAQTAEPAAPLPRVSTTNMSLGTNLLRGIQTDHLKALVWDAEAKEYTAKAGQTNATLAFSVTNASPSDVVIHRVRSSCGCTVTKLPRQPWVLGPGEGG